MTNFLGFLGKNKIIKIYTKSQSNDRSYHGLKVFFFFFLLLFSVFFKSYSCFKGHVKRDTVFLCSS